MDLFQSTLSSSLVPFSNFNLTSTVVYSTMHSFTSLLLVSGLALQTAIGLPERGRGVKEREAQLLKRSVDSFIETETPIALADLLCNIGSAGECVAGASSGVVVASPDRVNPDCLTPMSSILMALHKVL